MAFTVSSYFSRFEYALFFYELPMYYSAPGSILSLHVSESADKIKEAQIVVSFTVSLSHIDATDVLNIDAIIDSVLSCSQPIKRTVPTIQSKGLLRTANQKGCINQQIKKWLYRTANQKGCTDQPIKRAVTTSHSKGLYQPAN